MPSARDWTYAEALGAIWKRSGYDRGYISNPFAGDDAARAGLERTRRVVERLGGMPRGHRILHIAGSKGKGSTAAFLTAILVAAGYRTLTYTSPHLHQFRERIAIDGQAISEADFARLTETAATAARACEADAPALGRTTAFELVTAMALYAVTAMDCDVAVIETGLGGTLDATNIVDPAVSVITALDYEHTAILGRSLAEIASNKAGIIKPDRPAVTAAQPSEALDVIEAAAHERGAPLGIAGRDWTVEGGWRDFRYHDPRGGIGGLRTSLPGDHQMQNAGLAIAAIRRLDADAISISEDAIHTGLASAHWPGRFEVIDRPGLPRVLLDGAHTPASAAALADLLASESPSRPLVVVVGLFADKNPEAFTAPLGPFVDAWVITAPQSPRALAPADVAVALSTPASRLTETIPDALDAAYAIAGDRGTVLVTGSLATVAEARLALGLAEPDPPPRVPAL